MARNLSPLTAESLKDAFVSRFEHMILSGDLSIGEKLPAERDLAQQLGVSRPVVHEGLVDLVARGLLTIRPRRGAVVNDFRKTGSLALLNSLVNYEGGLDPSLLQGLLDMRELMEGEIARLAARHRSTAQVEMLQAIVTSEADALEDAAAFCDLDFDFHHQLAMASANPLYPLLLNSFRNVYRHLTKRFFTIAGSARRTHQFHREIVAAIAAGEKTRATEIMGRMLAHGRRMLLTVIEETQGA
ncbi:MAG: FadR/GntR family transcriptional regulator [Pseudomonadota bacterium]